MLKTGEIEKFATEEAFYERLGLQYISPELREGRNEIEVAEKRALPRLIEASDLRGDLHIHTGWRMGYAYMPPELVEPVVRLIANSVSCTAPFSSMLV